MKEYCVEESFNAGCMKHLSVEEAKLAFLQGLWMENEDNLHFRRHEGLRIYLVSIFPMTRTLRKKKYRN